MVWTAPVPTVTLTAILRALASAPAPWSSFERSNTGLSEQVAVRSRVNARQIFLSIVIPLSEPGRRAAATERLPATPSERNRGAVSPLSAPLRPAYVDGAGRWAFWVHQGSWLRIVGVRVPIEGP